MGKKLRIVFFILFLMVTCFSNAFAAEVTLAWDPSSGNPESYRIHYGTSPGNYNQNIDVGYVTEYTVSGLLSDVTYYFAASAYNEHGQSDYSNEVSWSYTNPINPAPAPPTGLHVVE